MTATSHHLECVKCVLGVLVSVCVKGAEGRCGRGWGGVEEGRREEEEVRKGGVGWGWGVVRGGH